MPESFYTSLRATVLLLVIVATALGAQSVSPDIRALNLATFDKTWTLVNDTYFDPTFNGIDWQAVREQLRPRAANAANSNELRDILEEMIETLGQSHFQILPVGPYVGTSDADAEPSSIGGAHGCSASTRKSLVRLLDLASTEALAAAEPGLDVRELDGEVLVFAVDPASDGAARGVAPGWRVLRIGRVSVDRFIPCFDMFDGADRRYALRTWLARLLHGPDGSSLSMTFEDGSGERRSAALSRGGRSAGVEVGGFGALPPTEIRFEVRWLQTPNGLDLAVVSFNIWLLPAIREFDAAMSQLRQAAGIVIDLRGNPGGIAAIAQGIAGHFLDQRLSLGTMKGRNDELRLVVNPRSVSRDGQRVGIYEGPLAILTDEMTASTSEVFTAGLQDLGRAHVVGQPTAGAALPSLAESLPNGDVFLHATMDFIRPNGERVEGRPILPDTPTRITRSDLLAGRDPALIAALEWIDSTAGGSP